MNLIKRVFPVPLFAFVLIVGFFPSSSSAQNFTATANALQTNTHNRFISSNGNYYKEDNGSATRFHYWWNAHALDTLADAYARTRDPVYSTRMLTLVRGIRSQYGGSYDNTFVDDLAWLGLASVRSYELTGNVEFLNVAEFVWVEMKKGYSNGAFTWEMGCHPNCKNAISNNPSIVLGARLHSIRANAADLQMITSVYDWVKSRLVDPNSGAVWDGVNLANNSTNRATYSYNQGLFIGAALEMYKLTGNQMYMNDAVRTADYVVNTRSPGGMIFANETGNGDGGLFKGIMVRYLALLAREGNIPAATRTRYINAVKFNATRLDTQGIRRPEMLIGANWSVAPGTITQLAMQLSGLMTIEAAVIVDQPMVYQHYNYRGRPAPLPNGSYNTAALAARGVMDNDITSITVPPGASLTIYENDNFTGASAVVTGNDTLLVTSGWNDRVSSIVVGATTPLNISNVNVRDTGNAGDWSARTNIQTGDQSHGDRTYTWSSVPASVAGGAWIRTANDSKTYTGNPLVSFSISATADVYVAWDDRAARQAWLDSTWIDTGENLVIRENSTTTRPFSLFRKNFLPGTVTLGPMNNGSVNNYTVIVK